MRQMLIGRFQRASLDRLLHANAGDAVAANALPLLPLLLVLLLHFPPTLNTVVVDAVVADAVVADADC